MVLMAQTWGVSVESSAPLRTLCNCCGHLDSGGGEATELEDGLSDLFWKLLEEDLPSHC